MKTYKDVESYIKSQPKSVQPLLVQLRSVIQTSAPKAEESISYGMPAYKYLGKPLVYFGAQKHHIGFYPTPSPIVAFKKELADFKQSKGAVQFPLENRLPIGLIKKMVKLRLTEVRSHENNKKK